MTIERINEIAKVQLTPDEILMLKLRVTRQPQDIAELLGMSRSGVVKILNRATKKIEQQKRL